MTDELSQFTHDRSGRICCSLTHSGVAWIISGYIDLIPDHLSELVTFQSLAHEQHTLYETPIHGVFELAIDIGARLPRSKVLMKNGELTELHTDSRPYTGEHLEVGRRPLE